MAALVAPLCSASGEESPGSTEVRCRL